MSRINRIGKATVARSLYIRNDHSTASKVLGILMPGIVMDIAGWEDNGQSINGNSKWFFDDNGNYYWSGAFDHVAFLSPPQTPVAPMPVVPAAPVVPVLPVLGGSAFHFSAEVVKQMIPGAPLGNIQAYLPPILAALRAQALADNAMTLVALATVATETGFFQPISEGVSKYNTSQGATHLFDLYDHRLDLGNNGPPDGERYKGRGFVQLTGRSNYLYFGHKIGLGDLLLTDPDKANDPVIAAQLLAFFLKSREAVIRKALTDNNLAAARRAVNGGLHGIDTFTYIYNKGGLLISKGVGAPGIL